MPRLDNSASARGNSVSASNAEGGATCVVAWGVGIGRSFLELQSKRAALQYVSILDPERAVLRRDARDIMA
ncbi:hypothetical protein GCM10011395_26730 [Sphingomonas psychrolutea]|uniref:Uncharacterized protein n=1 Tax=Sphingomonas psychrolutea TaxID=1259676 RepID=A0ABQ1H0W1_9SPHN|nr:hypothetical protein GCM10011395_26730 [Sphingomonas psychrolutea]